MTHFACEHCDPSSPAPWPAARRATGGKLWSEMRLRLRVADMVADFPPIAVRGPQGTVAALLWKLLGRPVARCPRCGETRWLF